MDDLKHIIEENIRRVLPDAIIALHSEDGLHFQAQVKSAQFREMKRLEQHRTVMNALADVIASNQLHALQLKTETL